MSDCPDSAHGHELAYKNNYRILTDDHIAQSCYCIHCGTELRRIYERTTPDPAGEPDIEYTLTETLIVNDPETILRKVDTHWPLLDWMEYSASHVENRPLTESGNLRAEEG